MQERAYQKRGEQYLLIKSPPASGKSRALMFIDVRQFMARDKTHIVAMTGSYFRGDAEAVLHPDDEARFDTVTYTYYEQLNGYQYLKQLDIGYYFYAGSYTDEIAQVLNPHEKTIVHIPNVNSPREHKG